MGPATPGPDQPNWGSGQNQFQLLFPPPALDFLLSHLGLYKAGVFFLVHEQVKDILRGKQLGKNFSLCFTVLPTSVIGEADTEPVVTYST